MRNVKKVVIILAVIVTAFFLKQETANASGFAVYTLDQTAGAQGMAVVAHTDSPSTIFYNPALMNTLQGVQAAINFTVIAPSYKFHSDITGKDYSGVDNNEYVPSLFITQKFNDKLSWGGGVYTPFGLSTNWGETWEGRYITTKASLQTINVNPAVSYRVLPNLSIAAGVDIMTANATLSKALNLSPLGLPDGQQTLKADDATGFGFNVGLAWDPVKDITVGAAYRSRIRLDFEGNVTNNLPSETPAPLASLFPDTQGSTDITLPDQVFFGVAYKGIDRLTVEAGGRWEGWSSYKELLIELQQPIAFSSESVTPKNWTNVWSFGVGTKYQLTDTLALMAGYLWQSSAVPDSTFEPSIPDNDSSVYSIGLKYQIGKLWMSPSYEYQHVYSRTKDNTVDGNPSGSVFDPATSANGTYRTNLQIVGLTVGYLF